MVCYLVDYNVQVGYEAAIQHSPIRIPYDDFVVKRIAEAADMRSLKWSHRTTKLAC